MNNILIFAIYYQNEQSVRISNNRIANISDMERRDLLDSVIIGVAVKVPGKDESKRKLEPF